MVNDVNVRLQPISDIATLSRMTGKDFSGPTPDIRAPEIIRMEEDVPKEQPRTQEESSKKHPRRRSRTPRTVEEGVEVVGDIDSYVDED